MNRLGLVRLLEKRRNPSIATSHTDVQLQHWRLFKNSERSSMAGFSASSRKALRETAPANRKNPTCIKDLRLKEDSDVAKLVADVCVSGWLQLCTGRVGPSEA